MMWTEFAHHGPAFEVTGGAMEGKETRFGVAASAIFSVATTLTSTGAVNSFPLLLTVSGAASSCWAMQLGEIAPGGVGSGLYGNADHGDHRGDHRRPHGRPPPPSTSARRSAPARSSSRLLHPHHPALVLCFTAAAMALPTPGDSHDELRRARLLRDPLRYTSGCQQQRLSPSPA
nr:potassium-transporting ATPase subunit KdpA [Streptomyces spororaveus]